MLLIRAQWSEGGTPIRRTKKLFNYTFILFLRLPNSLADCGMVSELRKQLMA